MRSNNTIVSVICAVIAVIVIAFAIFLGVLGIKSAINDTTFTDEWNNVWGIETVQEENPDSTDDETPSDVTDEETEVTEETK